MIKSQLNLFSFNEKEGKITENVGIWKKSKFHLQITCNIYIFCCCWFKLFGFDDKNVIFLNNDNHVFFLYEPERDDDDDHHHHL